MKNFGIALLLTITFGSAAQAAYHGKGRYDVDVVPVLLPSDRVTPLLAEGLEIAPLGTPGVPAGSHLVLMLFGYQNEVEPSVLPPFSWDYYETTLVVPFVRIAGGDGKVFHHAFRLYLDHHRAILAGRPYGFPKHYSSIHEGTAYFDPRKERTYTVASDDDGTVLIRGTFSQPIAIQPRPLAEMPNFAVVSEVFSRTSAPLIQKGPLGAWTCADFAWKTDEALGYPVEATVDASLADIGIEGRYQTPGLDRTTWGAFRMSVDWELTPPRSCR